MKNKFLIFSLLIIFLTVLIIAGIYFIQAQKNAAKPLQKITLGLSWIHQSQFTGEYYADQFELYKKEGLKVNFIPGSIDIDPIDKLISGDYDFALIQPDSLIKAVSEGKKIKAIAVTYKIHPLVFASLPAQNIKKPEDLIGKTIGVAYSEEIPLIAMLKINNIPQDKVKIVQRDYNYDKLYSGEFDVEADLQDPGGFQQRPQRVQRLASTDLVRGEAGGEQAGAVAGLLVAERNVAGVIGRQRQRKARVGRRGQRGSLPALGRRPALARRAAAVAHPQVCRASLERRNWQGDGAHRRRR